MSRHKKGFTLIGLPVARKRGFTLIELLLVIAIIGILATIMIIAYTNAQARTRDNKRKADIQAISSAVEMYYADKKVYPFVESESPASLWYRIRSVDALAPAQIWSDGFSGLLSGYIPTPLTQDPKNTDNNLNSTTWQSGSDEYSYTYLSTKYSYILAAKLEVLRDGNGDQFVGKTVKDANGSAIPLGSDALEYTIGNQLFFVGANLITP